MISKVLRITLTIHLLCGWRSRSLEKGLRTVPQPTKP